MATDRLPWKEVKLRLGGRWVGEGGGGSPELIVELNLKGKTKINQIKENHPKQKEKRDGGIVGKACVCKET